MFLFCYKINKFIRYAKAEAKIFFPAVSAVCLILSPIRHVS